MVGRSAKRTIAFKRSIDLFFDISESSMSFEKGLLLLVVLLYFSDYTSHAIGVVRSHLLAAAGLLV